MVGPLAPSADAAGETVFGVNPSSASGPGTTISGAEFFDAPPVIGLARTDKFPDSLTGGAHISRLGGPMLLTPPAPEATIAPPVKDYVCGNEASILEAYVYGGTLALSLGVEQELLQRIAGGC